MDWDDPSARAALAERVGADEYNRLQAEHQKASTVATVNGRAIRIVNTRAGRLYAVEGTGDAYTTLERAKEEAGMLIPPLT